MSQSQNELNRRNFMRMGAVSLAGAAVIGSADAADDPKAVAAKAVAKPAIIQRKLGRTGIAVPIVSMGVMNADNPAVVKAALDAGIRMLDTAHVYQQGRNEEMLGEVLQGRPRDSFVLATKVVGNGMDRKTGLFSAETNAADFMSKLEISLKRLKMDRVDILYLHNISKKESAHFEPMLKALEQAKNQGKTRFVGISTHANEPEVIRAAISAKSYDVVLTSYNFLQPHRGEVLTAITEAAVAGMGVVVMKTQAGVFFDKERQHPIDMKAALKWALQNPSVHTAIPGFNTFDQMQTDVAVLTDIAMTAAEKGETQPHKHAGLYCTGCGECVAQCPRGVPVPDLMRGYMYAHGYRNRLAAHDLLAEQGLAGDPCSGCSSCRVRCSRGFDVRERVADVVRMREIPREFLD